MPRPALLPQPNRLFGSDARWDRFAREAPSQARLTPFFRRLMAPLSAEDFLRECFEREPLLHRPSPAAWRHPALSRDLLSLLAARRLRPENVRVFDAQDRELARDRRARWLRQGSLGRRIEAGEASMSINGIERFHPSYRDLCGRFSEVFRVRASINCYITPQGRRTLPWHWDGHDVFIFQLAGEKLWRFFEPQLRLPLEKQTPMRNPSRSRPTAEHLLKPGEMLYVPRGIPHECLAKGGISQHLTLGLDPLRWYDVFSEMTHRALQACQTELAFRFNAESFAYSDAQVDRLFGEYKRQLVRMLEAQSPEQVLSGQRRAKSLWHQQRLGFRAGAPWPLRQTPTGRKS